MNYFTRIPQGGPNQNFHGTAPPPPPPAFRPTGYFQYQKQPTQFQPSSQQQYTPQTYYPFQGLPMNTHQGNAMGNGYPPQIGANMQHPSTQYGQQSPIPRPAAPSPPPSSNTPNSITPINQEIQPQLMPQRGPSGPPLKPLYANMNSNINSITSINQEIQPQLMPPAYKQALEQERLREEAQRLAASKVAEERAVSWKPRPKQVPVITALPPPLPSPIATIPLPLPLPSTQAGVSSFTTFEDAESPSQKQEESLDVQEDEFTTSDASKALENPNVQESVASDSFQGALSVKGASDPFQGVPKGALKAPFFAIGIDLGTTYSCVGVFRNGKTEIIANDFGNRTTPSVVSFKPDGQVLVGESAQSQAAINPKMTIFDAKRLIGRQITDPVLQEDIKHWPFVLQSDSSNNHPRIETLDSDGKLKLRRPEEVSALVLSKMKQIAESYLGHPVEKAVVTVPAYFNDAQRSATKDAGALAGLDIIRIINEPTAAAIAYGLDKTDKPESHILVFDLGGGTFDVSVLHLAQGIFTVKATGGNTHLGGEDFDHLVVNYVCKEAGLDDLSQKSMQRLRSACEKAKRALSSSSSTSIVVEEITSGKDVQFELTRATFEEINAHLFDQCIDHVRLVLQDAGLNRDEIDEVVFVGGSTRIPRIQELVRSYFGKEPNRSINPDEAVAYGAAVQAAILAGHAGEVRDRCLLMDVTPLSLGLETAGGLMSVLVPRNTTIPCLKTSSFSTHHDNQEKVLVSIFEGERQLCAHNHLLGHFYLEGIPPGKAGVPKIEVTFEVDVDGILHVSALETSTQVQNFISIKNESGRLTQEEIQRLLAEADSHKDEDARRVDDLEAKNELEYFLRQVQQSLQSNDSNDSNEQLKEKVSTEIYSTWIELIESKLRWLQDTSSEKVTKAQCDELKSEIELQLDPLLGKLYSQGGVISGQMDSVLLVEDNVNNDDK
jgi:heat shock protein 1/8